MRSVWSRVATDSRTRVVPFAESPARRIADFTCAEGTRVTQSMAARSARPATVSGGRPSSCAEATRAPIAHSGSIIRAIGRRRSDASPSSVVVTGLPARIPANNRRLVPELPHSRTPGSTTNPAIPGDTTRYATAPSSSVVRSTAAPRERAMSALERTSAPSPAPTMLLSP